MARNTGIGGVDILIKNIAWALRHLPVFGVFGTGLYQIQPIHVDDFAPLAVREGRETNVRVIDATGPETYTFRELVETIGRIIGRARPIVSIPPAVGHRTARALGLVLRDVVLTRPEIDALMADLLATDAPPAGSTRLTDWAREHAQTLGRRHASELARRRDRLTDYERL